MQIVTKLAYHQLQNTNEIPIVCLLIDENKNEYIEHNYQNEHAEMLIVNKYNCRNGIVFVNVEPCPMCLFALSLAKVKHIFFGCKNRQYGACGGKFHLSHEINYKISPYTGEFFSKINELIIQRFFQNKRKEQQII